MTNIVARKTTNIYGWAASGITIGMFVVLVLFDYAPIIWLKPIGFVFLISGFSLFIFALRAFSKWGKTIDKSDYMSATTVVDQGIFSIVRHPQYLGYMLFDIGLTMLVQFPAMIAAGLFAVVFFYFQMIKEEKDLLGKYGADYERYCQEVPRINFIRGLLRKKRIE
jgi:protein-S-isoprenylcysteine O-methyltransferase Ste14